MRHTTGPFMLLALLSAVGVLLLNSPACAKLNSAAYQEQAAREIVEQIFRATRLNEGASTWGEQYREDIDRYNRLFRTSHYAVFDDLGIAAAMARCAANAKNQSDADRWIAEMGRFDRAAQELDRKDQVRYYFAKGMAQLQAVPDKLRALPVDFYKAAENGLSSAAWAEYVVKAGADATGFGGERIADVFVRFAQSYRSGGAMDEAYKMLMLATRAASPDAARFVSMAQCASDLGSETLAYKTALLFLASFDLYDGMRPVSTNWATLLPLDARMPAEEFCRLCAGWALDTVLGRAMSVPPAQPDEPLKAKDLGRFDSRYAEPMGRNLGTLEDLFKIAICSRYWGDSSVVAWYAPRVSSAIDAFGGAVERLAASLREDGRFGASRDIALWEARRWKAAKRLEEFAQRYPERYTLSGIGAGD